MPRVSPKKSLGQNHHPRLISCIRFPSALQRFVRSTDTALCPAKKETNPKHYSKILAQNGWFMALKYTFCGSQCEAGAARKWCWETSYRICICVSTDGVTPEWVDITRPRAHCPHRMLTPMHLALRLCLCQAERDCDKSITGRVGLCCNFPGCSYRPSCFQGKSQTLGNTR